MKKIVSRFKKRLSITFGLLFIESIAELLFPLVIGIAINDLLNDSYSGLIFLGVLGLFTVSIGALRRLIDSRAYAYMYVVLGSELASNSSALSTSKKAAQLSLLNEIVEFLENSLPNLFTYIIGLVGTLIILFKLDMSVAIACVVASLVTLAIYVFTTRKTVQLNAGWNDEFEKRVDVVAKRNNSITKRHLNRFMKWNIRLSDLETVNYSLAWLTAIPLLVFTVATTTSASLEYGSIFAIVMYVFQFIESYTESPQYYQEWLRLKEISNRITLNS